MTDAVTPARPRRSLQVVWVVVILVAGVIGALEARMVFDRVDQQLFDTSLPAIHDIDVYGVFVDETPVPLAVSAGWQKVSWIATRDAIRTDATLWRKMRFEDWDTVPASVRTAGLDAMLTRYGDVLANPAAWDRMTSANWDQVPQPIRALAFRHMTEYWTGYYNLGGKYGIPRRTMSDTLAAVLLTESWFEHRAVNVNARGNRDLGIAQAADQTRDRMTAMYDAGLVDVLFSEEDYLDPWKSTRFAALWMRALLDEMNGDLNAAVRAYHRGSIRARAGEGSEYLSLVKHRLRRYIRNDGTDSSWNYLWWRDRLMISERWPWLFVSSGPRLLEKTAEVDDGGSPPSGVIDALRR